MICCQHNTEKKEIANKVLTRKIIQLAAREETIREGVRKMLPRRRDVNNQTKGFVFGGNDLPDGSDNAHLEQAKRIMASEESLFPWQSFRPVLTMKDESLSQMMQSNAFMNLKMSLMT